MGRAPCGTLSNGATIAGEATWKEGLRMKIQFLCKDAGSNIGNCPSISRVVEGPAGYVVVGKNIDPATRAQIPEIADDETAVFVPANVIDRIWEFG
jgi:hypothetical protein